MNDAAVVIEPRPREGVNTRTGGGDGSVVEPVRAGLPAVRVALVDDDDAVRRSLTRLLTCFGFAVVAFPSAEAFLEAGDLDELDAVLVDVELDGMSGTELGARLLAEDRAPPVVFISAAADAQEIVRTCAGYDALLLAKPLDAELLYDALSLVLGGTPVC